LSKLTSSQLIGRLPPREAEEREIWRGNEEERCGDLVCFSAY